MRRVAARRKRSLADDQAALVGDDMAAFRAALGADFTVADAVAAVSRCGGDTERAIRSILDKKGRAGGGTPAPRPRARGVKAATGFGAVAPPLPRPVKVEPADEGEDEGEVKTESIFAEPGAVKVKVQVSGVAEAKVEIQGEVGVKVEWEPIESDGPLQEQSGRRVKHEEEADKVDVKEEEEADEMDVKQEEAADDVDVKEEEDDEGCRSEGEVAIIDPPPRPKKKPPLEDNGVPFVDLTTSHPLPYLSSRPIRAVPPPDAVSANEWRMVVAPPPPELYQRPPNSHEWYFFKKSYATGLSTCRGRKLLDAGEVVQFTFPSFDWLYGRARVSARQAVALAETVRFSTNRSGEIGKLSPVWAKCLAPLVSSSKI